MTRTPKKKRYKRLWLQDGDLFRFRLQEKIACCDCGLVHLYEIYVGRNGHIYARVWRDEKQSKRARRLTHYRGLVLPLETRRFYRELGKKWK